jgi:cytochrome b6-f complex iron-sulfur subunit
MPTKDQVVKVWIDPGCIVCDACETACPEVFHVLEETCIVRPEALNVEFTRPLTSTIIQAAEECPVDVIKYEVKPFEVSETEAAEAAKPAKKAASHAAGAAAGTAKPGKASPAAPEGPVDPAMDALLRAVTARGGREGLAASSTSPLSALESLGKKRFEDLPPDARFARVLETARRVDEKADEADSVTRREFVNKALYAVGWAGVVGTTVIGTTAFGRFMMPNVLEEPESKVRVGPREKYAAMAPGDVNEDYKLKGIWMIRLEDRVAALSTTCTHLGCIPTWLENDRKFKCPCHGSGFKPNGINFEGPAPRPLERFKISEEDGVLLVDKKVKFLFEQGQWTNPDSYMVL